MSGKSILLFNVIVVIIPSFPPRVYAPNRIWQKMWIAKLNACDLPFAEFRMRRRHLRSIYDTLGPYPGYQTVMAALHERGYKRGQSPARELLRTWRLPE